MRLLQIKPHVRKAPRDPHADIREAKTRQLREEVALVDMEREICRLVDTAIGRGEWMPISTAPKDGTEIVVWTPAGYVQIRRRL